MVSWKSFVREHRELILATGMPVDVSSDQRAFDHLFMHGAHPNYPYYDFDETTPSERRALLELAARYISCFEDPGVSGFTSSEQHELERMIQSYADGIKEGDD